MKELETSVSGQNAHLMVPVFIFSILLSIAAIRGPAIISSAGIGSAVIVVAPLILATYALTIIVIAGRAGVDLSIGPLIGFLNVGLIQLFNAGFIESPIVFFLYAMGIGVAYQLVMGLIIVFVRVQPLIVALSGYLALVGLNLIILPRPGGVAPDWMLTWGSGTTIWSPVLVILIIATAAWYALANTAFFAHLRLMGSDERAAYTSGVKINIVRLGAHCIAGIYAGLAAICFTSLISSGDPTQGTTFTLLAVTALVLGGANLAGGRGGALGSLFGALNIYLITYLLGTFNFGRFQSFVTDLSYGTILVLSLLISLAIPQIKQAARYLSPALFITILAAVAGGVIIHSTMDIGVARQAATIGGLAPVTDTPSASGTIVMLVILGLGATIYLVSLLFRYPRPPAIALVIAAAVAALGLIFHGGGMEGSGITASNGIGNTLEYLALESLDFDGAASHSSGLVAYAAYGAILVLGITLLSSLIIGLNLPWAGLIPRAAPAVLLGIGVLAIVSIKAGSGGGLFGAEALIVILAGMILFALAFSPPQAMAPNISNIFIAGFCLLAVGFVYFAAAPKEAGNGTRAIESANSIFAARPVQNVEVSYAGPRRSSAPARVNSTLSQWAYSILLIGLLQFFLWKSMGGYRLRQFWPFLHIVTGSAIAWGALFYSIGVSLWNIAAIAVLAAVSAPFVWRAFDFYPKGRLNGVAAP